MNTGPFVLLYPYSFRFHPSMIFNHLTLVIILMKTLLAIRLRQEMPIILENLCSQLCLLIMMYLSFLFLFSLPRVCFPIFISHFSSRFFLYRRPSFTNNLQQFVSAYLVNFKMTFFVIVYLMTFIIYWLQISRESSLCFVNEKKV